MTTRTELHAAVDGFADGEDALIKSLNAEVSRLNVQIEDLQDLLKPGIKVAVSPVQQFIRTSLNAGQVVDNLLVIAPPTPPAGVNNFVLIKAWDPVTAPTVFFRVTARALNPDARNRAAFQGVDTVLINADLGGCIDGIKDMGGVHSRHTRIQVVWVPVDDAQGGGPSHSDGIQMSPSPKPSTHFDAQIELPDKANAAVMINGPRGEVVLDGHDVSVVPGGRIASVVNVAGTVSKLTITNCVFPDVEQVNNWANAHCLIPAGIPLTLANNLTASGKPIVVKRT